MTIVVGVAAPDGLILAGDSRTTLLWDNGRHRIISDSTQKVFPICGAIGIATYGDAFVGSRTIAGLMDEFVGHLGEAPPAQIETVADSLGHFFHERFEADSPPDMLEWCEQNPDRSRFGFLVGGYDADTTGRIMEVTIPGPSISINAGGIEITTAARGVCWRGQTDVIRRLITGFDGDLFVELGHELPETLREPIETLGYSLHFPITMQDAIDFACFLIRTTIDMQRFSDGTHGKPGGVPGCGGAVRVLAITRSGVEWIATPMLSTDREGGVAEDGRR